MRKNNIDNFLSKFENRIEIIGKDGVKGIMKHTGPSINENNFIFQNDLFNNIYNKNLTTRNMLEQNKNILKDGNNKNPSYSLSKSYKFQNFNVFKNNYILFNSIINIIMSNLIIIIIIKRSINMK